MSEEEKPAPGFNNVKKNGAKIKKTKDRTVKNKELIERSTEAILWASLSFPFAKKSENIGIKTEDKAPAIINWNKKSGILVEAI